MEVSPNALRKETVTTLRSIEATIETVKEAAHGIGVEPEKLQYSDGTWPLIPLLLAKSQCLNTLVLLQEQGRRK